jgi:LCP family protein required for cell wall assembly
VKRRRALTRLVSLAAVLAIGCLVVPDSAVHPTRISLTEVQNARSVDFADDIVWILVLGSDARPGQDLDDARTDAIHLVGLDIPSRRAAGIGIPRDFWMELPGGSARINAALAKGGAELVADVVSELVGITPHYVVIAGFDGFRDLVDTIDGVTVEADEAVPELGVRRGPNDFDGPQALAYARTRDFAGADFARSANHQDIMMGILRRLLAREDEEGFIEGGALAALQGLSTDLGPTELYRLAQAVTQIRPDRVTTCVLTGTDAETSAGDQVLIPDWASAGRIGADARDDARIDRGC